jgi:hypothetical protein
MPYTFKSFTEALAWLSIASSGTLLLKRDTDAAAALGKQAHANDGERERGRWRGGAGDEVGGGWDWGSTQGGEEEVGEESEEPSVSRWQVGELGNFFESVFLGALLL